MLTIVSDNRILNRQNQDKLLYPETLLKQPLEYLHWWIFFGSNYLNFKIIFLSHLLLISFILFKLFARWSLVKMSVKINSVLPGIEYWVHLLQMQMINISQSWLFRSNLFKGFLSQIISQLFLNFQMTKIQNYHVVIVSVTIASRSSSQNGFTKKLLCFNQCHCQWSKIVVTFFVHGWKEVLLTFQTVVLAALNFFLTLETPLLIKYWCQDHRKLSFLTLQPLQPISICFALQEQMVLKVREGEGGVKNLWCMYQHMVF